MCRLFVLLCLLVTPALAADADHFDRETVVGSSAAFRSVSKTSMAALEPRERALTRTDQALADLDLSLALSRGAIDAGHHDLWVARLDERSTRFGQEFETLQQELTAMSVGYEEAFEAALARSVEGLGSPAAECVPSKDLMSGLAQPGGASSTSACPGKDRSAELAAAWDKDATLKAALDAIDPTAFQDVTSYDGEEPPLTLGAGSGPSWVHPAALAEALPEAIEAIDTVDRRASEARQSLRQARADIPDDAPDLDDRRKKIVERARGIRAWSEDQKAAIGAAVWASLERNRKKGKKAGWSNAGLCLNPAGWSACPGEDVTTEVADTLVDDRKLAKALAALLDSVGSPDVSLN